MIFLENEHLKVSFENKGAELRSLVNKQNNINYLWNGNATYWAKFSPVLFPIVGGLKDNTYHFENNTYQLPRHGFARDQDFEAISINDTELVFKLNQNEETLKNYPFQFILQLRYRLQGSQLSCTYEVRNPSQDNSLWFSIGAHPAFSVPLKEDLLYTDYFLEFNKDHSLASHKIKNDLITNETLNIEIIKGRLPLAHELFYDDALVFKSLKSNCITLGTKKDKYGLNFKFNDFPFFGIWAAKDANFVCLEPWCGVADGIDHEQDLKKKEGIIELGALENWSRSWEVNCF
ncbi:MAG: aldose 1-epimerase family protein [Pedobacter sp.]|uniref:aldose 1-epimerase family protein n=1 Tax=Pedobacter sp. TaxID=1411316 RepID=UPI003563A833